MRGCLLRRKQNTWVFFDEKEAGRSSGLGPVCVFAHLACFCVWCNDFVHACVLFVHVCARVRVCVFMYRLWRVSLEMPREVSLSHTNTHSCCVCVEFKL